MKPPVRNLPSPPPAVARNTPPPPANQTGSAVVRFGAIPQKKGQRVTLYGTGGIGKTTLACQAPGKTAFVDADESLPVLKTQLAEIGVELPVIVPAGDFASLRSALQSSGWDGINNIVLDTATKIEQWGLAWTLKNVKHEKGHYCNRVEDYGFGKGFQHAFDTFELLLGDLDVHVRAGRNVFFIAHECTSNVPNPRGEDWIRYEPRLQSPSSGKASIRHRVKEWSDHMLFLGYDVAVGEDRKARGKGTRTLYTAELPFCMAKSRTTNVTIDISHGVSPWDQIIK